MITEPVNMNTKNAHWFNDAGLEIYLMDIEFTDKLISDLKSINMKLFSCRG